MGKEEHIVTVVVACVIFNEQDRLLMIQEAKKEYHGKWYLPAGKILQGEHIKEGAMREIEEETGLKVEPSGIFSLEYVPSSNGYLWLRYGITGKVIGGTLKVKPDINSLCAKWVTMTELKSMLQNDETRGNDITQLVTDYRKHHDHLLPFRN